MVDLNIRLPISRDLGSGPVDMNVHPTDMKQGAGDMKAHPTNRYVLPTRKTLQHFNSPNKDTSLLPPR